MLDEKGQMICIPTLEWLQTKIGMDDAKHAEALAGTIHINLPKQGDNKIKVTELDIYDRYAPIFPNITITYGNNMDVEGASRINFYRLDKDAMANVDIKDVEPYFFALTAKDTYTLADLINTPTFVNPVKNQTVSNTYSFTGRWIDWVDKKIYYQDIKVQNGFKKEEGDILFSTFKPSTQMQLVPIFKSNVRQYQVTLYDYDGSVLVTTHIDYNSNIGDYFESNVATNPNFSHAYYNYREWTDETQPDKRWSFKGWQSATDWKSSANEATYTYLNNRIVTSDIVFYAFYKEENIYTDISMIGSKNDFFIYTEGIAAEGVSGAEISLSDKYRYLLQGKITLPATTPSGTPIVRVGNFSAKNSLGNIETNTKFTHIYFENADANHYITIGNSAFSTDDGSDSRSGLQVIELPASIKSIEGSAFKTNINLHTVKLNNNIYKIAGSAFWNCKGINSFGIEGLPASLSEIGTAAFYNAGPGLHLTELPIEYRSIESWTFAGCSNVNINIFGSEVSPMTKITNSAFNNTGNNTITSMTIYCNNGAIEQGAFSNYNVSISNLTIYSPSGTEDYPGWGLNMTANATITQQTLATGG